MPDTGAFHVTFNFEQDAGPRATGWSCSFWNGAGSLNDVIPAAKALAPLLQALVGKQTVLTFISARFVYPPGPVRGPRITTNVYLVKPGGAPVNPATDATYPTSALLLSLRSAAGGTSRETLRGIPQANIGLGGWYTPAAGYGNLLTALLTALALPGNNWTLRQRASVPGPFEVQGFDTSTGIVSARNHGLPVPPIKVQLGGKGIGAVPRLNNVWKVLQILDANTFKIAYPLTTGAQIDLSFASAYGQLYGFTNNPIVFAPDKGITSSVDYVTEHKVGRPRLEPSGRRKRPA